MLCVWASGLGCRPNSAVAVAAAGAGAATGAAAATAVLRDQVIHTTDNAAYVVGIPNLSDWGAFPDSSGARREAEGVDTLFRAQGFASVANIDAEAAQILAGLRARPWQVLHLAGHGQFDGH